MKKIDFENVSIKKQIKYLVLACSLITMLVAGGISLYGMLQVKSNANQIGTEIGVTAAENSSKTLKKVSLDNLQLLVQERAKLLYYSFVYGMTWNVKFMAYCMNIIQQEPQEFTPYTVDEPSRENDGKLVPQLQYKSGVNRAELAHEVGLAANFQYIQVRLFEGAPTLTANYIASVNGFNITVDRNSALRVDENNIPKPNDYSTRPWYQNAVRENKLVVSNVFSDARGRGLAISCSAPYYNINGEIAGVVGEGRLLKEVAEYVNSFRFGDTGFAFVIDGTGHVFFSPRTEGILKVDPNNNGKIDDDPALTNNSNSMLAETAKSMARGETGIELVEIDGKNYYLAYTPIMETNWSLGMVIEESELTLTADTTKNIIEEITHNLVSDMNSSIRFMILAMFAVLIGVMFFAPLAGKKVADKMTQQMMILTDGVREIASGNLDKKIEVTAGNEIGHLAICFNEMAKEIKDYMANLTKVTADKERIATELNVATNIQLSMLPHDFNFNRDDFEIYATMHAAKAVGGDFYDFYLLDENHLVITMADVSGKGVPAALFMARSKTILKNFAMTMQNPDDFAAVMTLANNQLCQDNDEMMFVTVFMGMLDLKTGKFIYVNGGHNPPMVYSTKEKSYSYLKVEQNCVLGLMDEMDFEQQETQLEAGDLIYLYTDGVTEAMNEVNEQYTEERLQNCFNSIDPKCELPEILAAVKSDIAKHVGNAEQSDDITMLAVRFNG